MKKSLMAIIGLAVVAALAFGTGAFAEETYPDQFVAGPTIYHKIFENDKLRVSEIAFKPDEAIATHAHAYDHLIYILEAGQLTLSYPDGKASVVDGTVGQTMWVGKETHSAKNTGTANFRALIIELK